MELQLLQQILEKLEELKAGQQRIEASIAAIKKNTDHIPHLEQSVLELRQNICSYRDLIEQTQTTTNLKSPYIKNKHKRGQKTANLRLL